MKQQLLTQKSAYKQEEPIKEMRLSTQLQKKANWK